MKHNLSEALERLESISTQYLHLPDGRRVSYIEIGDPNGTPAFYFHGSPSCRFEAIPLEAGAKKAGLRIIAPDRPGIGQSDMKKKYSLLEYAEDVRDMAAFFGWEKYGVMGLSGGGTTVSSLAYAYPERILFALDISGWAPINQDKQLRKNVAFLDLFFGNIGRRFPAFFACLFIPFLWCIKHLSADTMVRMLKKSLNKPDRAFLADRANRVFFHRLLQECLKTQFQGATWDALLRYTDWGFAMQDIKIPVHFIHGTDDGFAPFSFCQWKAHQVAHGTQHVLEGKGHLNLLEDSKKIFEVVGTCEKAAATAGSSSQ